MRRRWFGIVVVVGVLAMPVTPAAAGSSGPSGRIIFYDAFGGSGLYAVAPDGTSRVRLAEGDDIVLPRWIPGGSGVSFLDQRSRYAYRLVRVDDNGGNRTTVVSPDELPEGWAIGGYDWSPDASQLVLSLTAVGEGRTRLVIASADGTILGTIARFGDQPDWSSTGRIAVVRGGVIITMNTFGGSVESVVVDGASRHPRWSPDGSQLVYEHIRPRDAWFDVWVVNADGTGATNLTRSPDVYDWTPSWSPTGRHIVWSASPPDDPFGYADLWRMRANGRGRTPIATTNRIDEYEPDWGDVPV